ncbi:MAG: pantetheine-phosphate adenylyltransferase [Clostridiales bacterium]|nr:pantetheine-phosphate adenylyltransferase [Clostridiales bacterium]
MKAAICPGSFDPVTMGHLDIIERAAAMFDRVIVLVMANSAKRRASFTIAERMELLRRCTGHLDNITIDTHEGLLVDYARKSGAVAIVKGLRAVTDYDYEFQQALTNKRLYPGAETVFLTASANNMFLSSSIVKEVCALGGDISSFVPDLIHDEIQKRCSKGD